MNRPAAAATAAQRGAVFAVPSDKQRRYVIGVTKQESLVDHVTSYATPLSSEHALAFIRWWVNQQKQTFDRTIEICGLTTHDATCQ